MGKGTGISICSQTDRQAFSSSVGKELNVTRPTYSLIVHLSVLNLLTTASPHLCSTWHGFMYLTDVWQDCLHQRCMYPSEIVLGL